MPKEKTPVEKYTEKQNELIREARKDDVVIESKMTLNPTGQFARTDIIIRPISAEEKLQEINMKKAATKKRVSKHKNKKKTSAKKKKRK